MGKDCGSCPADSKSIRYEIPDDQTGRIAGAIVLPSCSASGFSFPDY